MRYDSFTQKVSIFCRPFGIEFTIDISKSPYKISARVRGMGVALITSTLHAFVFADKTER
ncbi:MAG: hypothetical protein L6V93_15735 [Clostridiales bacterium]|nr:MAG: hypothetical protein L6V93_15735 [Clostridiales bacterium]